MFKIDSVIKQKLPARRIHLSRAFISTVAVSALLAVCATNTIAKNRSTETVVVVAPRQEQPVTATVNVKGDDSALGNFVVVWPGAAYRLRTDGQVTLNCLVDAYGLAESCSVASESPPDHGFGRAALELRPTFKLQPARGPNGPMASTMSIAIHFKAPLERFQESAYRQGNTDLGDYPRPVGLVVLGNPLTMREVTMMDHPIWVQAATFEDLAKSYPGKAGNVEGYAVAHCRVEKSGELAECQIIKELPEGLGFKEAALSLTDHFRILPELARTPSRSPLWVDLPIRFPPPSAASAQHSVSAPMWLVRFDPDKAPKVFPTAAAEGGLVSGLGVAKCVVGSDGSLINCVPGVGDPDGMGFSEAAVALASVMKMNLWSADAAPVVGAVANVPIRLNLK